MLLTNGIRLDQYRTQAKELLKKAKAGDSEALARLHRSHPEGNSSISPEALRLADCQLVIAREMGYGSWARLKQDLLFRSAVAALDAGDLTTLDDLLQKHPSLVRYRCRHGEWYESGYFQGAMLLHHIAGNPIRSPLPTNILEVTRLLLKQGVDPNVRTEGGATPIGLLLTSKQASEAGVALPLMDLLKSAGAKDVISGPEALTQPLLNAAPATADALIHRGAQMDIRHAAGLGRLDKLETFLAEDNTPLHCEEALVFASIRGQEEAAQLLTRHGAKGDILMSPGGMTPRSALHEAANRGYQAIVKLLVENGADVRVIDPHFGGTPAGWARHGGHEEIAALLEQRSSEE